MADEMRDVTRMLEGLREPEQARAAVRMLSLLADLIAHRHTGQVILDCRDGLPLGARVQIVQRWER